MNSPDASAYDRRAKHQERMHRATTYEERAKHERAMHSTRADSGESHRNSESE